MVQTQQQNTATVIDSYTKKTLATLVQSKTKVFHTCSSITRFHLVYPDPWDMENLIAAELNENRTSLSLTSGAIPSYSGHIPGYKFRFGESYGNLSVVKK